MRHTIIHQRQSCGGYMASNRYIIQSRARGFLHLYPSIILRGIYGSRFSDYRTVTDFLDALGRQYITVEDPTRITLPFLHKEHGLGDVIFQVADRFPQFIKSWFRGCTDRQWWLNQIIRFQPTQRVRNAQTLLIARQQENTVRDAVAAYERMGLSELDIHYLQVERGPDNPLPEGE